jgi:hypothetical protein
MGDALRTQVITHLPVYLVLRHVRVLFNFDTFDTEKITKRFEFPTEIDMEDYCSEELITSTDVKFDYELVQITTHVGTMSEGRHCLYVLDQDNNSEKQWYKFDRHKVTKESEDIVSQTFGSGGIYDETAIFTIYKLKSHVHEESKQIPSYLQLEIDKMNQASNLLRQEQANK